MTKLANEKTLELNITHELMNIHGVGTIGFTQQYQEPLTGADIQLLLNKPTIIQFKAAKSGVDGQNARYRINNNGEKNQHRTLDVIDRSGLVDAYYAFPLVISDSFLTSNFGRLRNYTCMVRAQSLTGNLNWINQAHSVIVDNYCNYRVFSSKIHKGQGFSARNYWEIASERFRVIEIRIDGFLKEVSSSLNAVVQDAGIIGNSEHTLMLMGTDKEHKRLGLMQLPILIEGLKEESDEKVKFN